MRRLLVLATLLGLLAFPATATAATPSATLGVSSAHYVARGVIEVDVAYSCVAPTAGWDWEPYFYVELSQGRGRNWRGGYVELPLTRAMCDGAVHVKTVQMVSDEGPAFRGGRVSVWADLDASWWNGDEDYMDQWACVEGARMQVRHR